MSGMAPDPTPSPPSVGTTSAPLALPPAPAIAGFRFRHFNGPADYAGMVRANMAARRHDGVVETVSVEGMASEYAHLTNSDLTHDLLIGEVDGGIVAYGRTEWTELNEGGRGYISICLVDPAWRRRGIGRAMLRWQEERRRQVAAGHRDVAPRWLISYAPESNQGATALLSSEGYTVVRRYHEMVRPNLGAIADATVPAGLELRSGRPDQARQVWEAMAEAFRDHFGEQDESEAAYQRFVNDPQFNPALWVVAWDGDEVAGVVINLIDDPEEGPNGPERLATLDAVSVRRPWRRRGLARAMVAESLRRVRDAGATRATLGVDTDNENRALDLYTRAGFAPVNTELEWRKSVEA